MGKEPPGDKLNGKKIPKIPKTSADSDWIAYLKLHPPRLRE
jgi:hypothetical protein